MKRKFMCLFLALAMALSCFAFVGCSSDEDETVEGGTTDETALTTVTLTLWIPTGKNTTEDAILAVQEAINKITKAKFETAIELHAIPENKYDEAIDARITEIEEKIAFEAAEAERKRQEAKELAAQGITTAVEETTAAEETTASEEETYVNDIGMTVLKYPEVEETQMDIFLVRGLDNYKAYIERAALSALDSELNGTSKILKQYIYPTFLSKAKIGSTYAIPNNHVIGEYKYLLVNKALVEKLYWDPEELTTLTACKDFILDVKNFTTVTPMLAEAETSGMHYWSEKDGDWSLLASRVPNEITADTTVGLQHTYSIGEYTDTISMMKHLKEAGCIATDASKVKEFGVAVVSGDAALPAQYEEDYYVYVHEKPMATTDDIYGSMFAVSAYTKSVARSMEIITMLNTDPELRTILQYGVEDVHWQIDERDEDVIKVISKAYQMNLRDTGNVYMTYPAAGVPMTYWDSCKQQNLDSLVSPFLGFSHADYYTEETAADFKALSELSKSYAARVAAMTAAEFDEQLLDLKIELNNNDLILKMTNSAPEAGVVTPASLFAKHK
ncbi:MAG: hypothetical protein E7662_03155 [Ruminococcaceae bacterium]|nr:hypothetical protein [Oscillospiraceae bacterium]